MLSQDEFCELVLDFISDDYEAPSTITSDIARALARDVSEREVLDALLALARDGRAKAYVFSEGAHHYLQVDVGDAPLETLWFLARR